MQEASAGDTATLPETRTTAAEQVEAMRPDGGGVEEVVADKGCHSDATLTALDDLGGGSQLHPGAGAGAAPLAGQEDG